MSDEIPDDVINAMCLTWRHDFGLPYSEQDAFVFGTTGPTPGEKMALQRQMRQIYQHHVLPIILAERERWKPAVTYFERYCQDEAEDAENCVCGEQQHEDAKAFASAIRYPND